MALLMLFMTVGVLLAAPQIGIGFVIVGVGAALSVITTRLFVGGSATR